MGNQDGGGLARRARRLAPLAALAGAAAAGAAAAWRHRHPPAPTDPDASLAGPPRARASVATSHREVADDEPEAPVAALVAALAPALEPSADAEPAAAAPPEPTAGRPPLVRRGADGPVPGGDATAGGASAATTLPIRAPVITAVAGDGGASGNGAGAPDHRAASGPPVPPPGPSSGSPDPAVPDPPPWGAERRFDPTPPAPHPTDSPAGDAQPTAPSPPAEPPPWRAERRFDPTPPAPHPTGDPAGDAPPAAPPPPPTTPPVSPLPRPPAPSPAAVPPSGARHRRRRGISRHLASLRRHRVRLLAGLIVVGLGIGASAGLAGVGGDEPASAPATTAPEPTEPPPATTTTTRPALEVDEAFATAAERLSGGGTFRYEGSARATDVSFVRPMMWLSVQSTVTGEVELATGRLHEVAIGAGGRVSETITEGTVVWGRRAPLAASLAEVPFALVPELSEPDRITGLGLVMLPTWLAAATDPVELEPSESGLPQYQATVPAEVVGEVERGIEPEDLLAVVALDDDGTPVRVELTTTTSDRLHLVLTLTGVGEPVTITPPVAPPT
jgi:hypothetical protein